MNNKQKIVLWFAAILIIGQLAGRFYVSIRFSAWDIFLSRTVRTLPLYIFVAIVTGILIYVFKDKKPKLVINCPKCGRLLKGATQEMIGDIGVCPKCKAEFAIEKKGEKPKEKAITVEMQNEPNKGRASTLIAVLLIVLQIIFILGGLYGGRSQLQGKNVSFHDLKSTVQSIIFLSGTNIIGIGALALSLIVWLYHKDKAGKVTTIIACIVILVNSLIAVWY